MVVASTSNRVMPVPQAERLRILAVDDIVKRFATAEAVSPRSTMCRSTWRPANSSP